MRNNSLNKTKTNKNQEQNQFKDLIVQENSVPKFLDPIDFHRIIGDFIIPNKFYSNCDIEPIYLFPLINNFKYIKQIHIRPMGIILEYEYRDNKICDSTSTKLLIHRLETLGDRRYYQFGQMIRTYENYLFQKLNIPLINDSIDVDMKSLFEAFDSFFTEFSSENLYFFGQETINNSDHGIRFLGFNNNILSYCCIEENPNLFHEDVLSALQHLLCYNGMEIYLGTIYEIMYNTINKFKSDFESPITYLQFMDTICGFQYCKINIAQNIERINNVLFTLCFIDNNEENDKLKKELNNVRKNYSEKIVKNVEKQKIEDLGKLISLYYHK